MDEPKAVNFSQQSADELVILDAAALRFEIDEYDDLVMHERDAVPKRVRATRAFPLTHRDEYVRIADREDNELGLIRHVRELDAASRDALEHELKRTYVLAKILRIHEIEEQMRIPSWTVETDRGPRVIEIGSTKRDIRSFGQGHVVIRDADGNQFEIPDYHDLDPPSRALLESQI